MAAVPSIGRAAHVERAARDADATHNLFERYSGQIFGYCVNQLGSRDEADDALQTTFLNAHRALQRGVKPEAELAWLFTIAHNVCLTRRRSSRRRGRVESPSDLAAVQDLLPAPLRESPDDLIRLTAALEHMPENQRHAILLREWQGLSYHEIADELKLSQSAVETLIFRARRTLASNLESEDKQPSTFARMRKAVDVGSLLMVVKGLFQGGAAVKVAAAAVAASGVVVVATAPPASSSKPTPQKQAVGHAAPTESTAAPVPFRSTGSTESEPVVEARAPAVSRPVAALVAPAAAAAPQQAEKHRAKEEPKATPPGQAKRQGTTAQAHGNARKPKKLKEKARGSTVAPPPAPVQAAVATPTQDVAGPAPASVEATPPAREDKSRKK